MNCKVSTGTLRYLHERLCVVGRLDQPESRRDDGRQGGRRRWARGRSVSAGRVRDVGARQTAATVDDAAWARPLETQWSTRWRHG